MAILTTAEAKVFLPSLTAASTTEDASIDIVVARVGARIARHCGWVPASDGGTPSLEAATHTLYLAGPGGRSLYLPMYPVISVTSIEDDSTEAFDGTTYLVASSDYSLRPNGEVLLAQTAVHGGWSSSHERVVKVVASLGYSTVDPILKQAAGLLFRHWWDLRFAQGRTNASAAAGSIGYRDEEIPPEVAAVLGDYLLPGVLLG